MGIKLIVEFMDSGPPLTATEWKAMVVLLEDANDRTRLTWSAVTDPKITRRVGLSPDAWTNLRGVLVRKKALIVAVPARRGRVAKYRVPIFAPAQLGHEIDDSIEKDHGSDDLTAPMAHETHDETSAFVMGSMTPTPLYPSGINPPPSPPSPPPSDPPIPPELTDGREDGGIAALDEQHGPAYDALLRITATDPRLTIGEREALTLVPLVVPWLERTTAEALREALTAGLPAQVGSPVGLLRTRLLAKLPPARAAPATASDPGLPPWCEKCADEDPAARFNVRLRRLNSLPCPNCHPDAAAAA